MSSDFLKCYESPEYSSAHFSVIDGTTMEVPRRFRAYMPKGIKDIINRNQAKERGDKLAFSPLGR
jgi:hypothetical protein